MKPVAFTENERALIVQALQKKAESDRMHARRFRTPGSAHMHEQFNRQAEQASTLAKVIEAADRIAVWPAEAS